MTDLQHKKIKDWRLHVLLLVASCIVIVDFFPLFGENDNPPLPSLQLYAGKDGRLLTFYSKNVMVEQSSHDIPVTLAPFFFEPLNINRADEETLMIVKGIGPKLSKTIVMQRHLYGPFMSVDDLAKLKGIGPKRAKYFSSVFSFGDQH